MIHILKAPHLGTAEEDVLVAEWMLKEGEDFKKGQVLLVLETLKASFEIEAEADGTLHRHLAAEGERIPLQAPLGIWGEQGAVLDTAEMSKLLEEIEHKQPNASPAGSDEPVSSGASTSGTSNGTPDAQAREGNASVSAAPAARRRAAELGIDIKAIQGSGPAGLIRLADVENASTSGASKNAKSDGHLDPTFLAHLRDDPAKFGALASDFKVHLYRNHGALIGEGAKIGAGSVLITERLVLGSGCVIRDECRIEAKEFIAGDLLYLGPGSRVRCTRVELGQNAFFAEQADIGGGGALDPESELRIGSHGFVGENVHLNPCRGIQIGDEVVLSRGAVIMTHSFGGSLLAGYPVRFAPVSIGDASQVGIQATLFPGVSMAAGSILLSGSSLVTDVPAGRLFGGVPATDQKAAARPLGPELLAKRAKDTLREFARQLELRGHDLSIDENEGELTLVVRSEGREHHLHLAGELAPRPHTSAAEEVLVALSASDEDWEAIGADRVAIDLSVPRIRGAQGPLADAWREFLRKQGVRLRPRTWSYGGGWL